MKYFKIDIKIKSVIQKAIKFGPVVSVFQSVKTVQKNLKNETKNKETCRSPRSEYHPRIVIIQSSLSRISFSLEGRFLPGLLFYP